jgi:c-di-GMP-binding flagellar brake protein YcgR
VSDLSSFSIQNPKQIRSYLSLLLRNKCLFCARFGANGESYITTLLCINEENNAVVLDYGSKENINNQALKAKKVTFDGEFRGIKVSFTGTALKKIIHKGDPAFSMPMPKMLFWMERREYYRVKIPLSKPSYCQLMLEGKEPINLKLHNISLSGLSMLNVSKELVGQMNPNTSFAQCKLILPEAGEHMIPFEIRYSHIINPDKLHKIQKIGCKFIKITRSFEDAIQSYMQRIQREDLQGHMQNPEETIRHRKILVYSSDE